MDQVIDKRKTAAGGIDRSKLKTGMIDFFEDRYGFILPDDGPNDVFLRWTTVKSCRINKEALTTGRRVKYLDRPGDRGPNPQATYIELA